MAEFGYAGEIIKVDLSSGRKLRLSTAHYARNFLGGRGIGARIYWEMAPVAAGAFDSENPLVFVTGPVTGFNRLAGPRWQVCGKSPLMQPEFFSYANLGERWGSYLKFAGYDGLIVQGKAEKPCYIYINNGALEVRDASHLWGRSAFEAADTLKGELGKGVSVLTIGPAAENLVVFGTMITDDGASGASGLGSVMGSKTLKAVVVAGEKRPAAADPERLDSLAKQVLRMRRDIWQDYLLDIPGRVNQRACWGCGIGCWRKSYESGGRRYKFLCQAGSFYSKAAREYDPDWVEVTLLSSRLCDRYGLDTIVLAPIIDWLVGCHREGILTEADTGLPLSRIGSADFIEKLTEMIAMRCGFGELLARGPLRAAEEISERACEILNRVILTRASENRDYDPRLILTTVLLYSTEPRRAIGQIHELSHAFEFYRNWKEGKQVPFAFLDYNDFLAVARNFWGGDAAADFSTYEGKALASRLIQDRTHAKECGVFCDFMWPIIWLRYGEDRTGDPAMESRVLSAVTGREIDEAGFNLIGERAFNLQRAILLRQGWGGRAGDRLLDHLHDEPLETLPRFNNFMVPGKNGEMVSRKGAKIERDDFEKLKSEYYELRGWGPNGLPTERKLGELGLGDVAADLRRRGLLSG
jgi:aldehyde:ferredoxin oxidoreductase